jgi:hypothetical protein
MSIKREKVKLLIPDASPLISLAHGGEDCLELIFKAKLPVVMTDQVLFEATYRKDELQDAAVIDKLVPETQTRIKVVATKIGEAGERWSPSGSMITRSLPIREKSQYCRRSNRSNWSPGRICFFSKTSRQRTLPFLASIRFMLYLPTGSWLVWNGPMSYPRRTKSLNAYDRVAGTALRPTLLTGRPGKSEIPEKNRNGSRRHQDNGGAMSFPSMEEILAAKKRERERLRNLSFEEK